MKKIFFTLALFYSSLYATDWKDFWIRAIEDCNERQFEAAEKNFDLAIEEMEKMGDPDYPYIYVDRGRLYFLLEKFPEALSDLDKALASDKLKYNDIIRALTSRICIRSRLGMDKGALEDLEKFGKIYHDIPTLVSTEKSLIIRNVPDCECVQNMFFCYFIHSGICNSKQDIQIMDSKICIVNKTGENNDTYADQPQQNRLCDNCGKIIIKKNNCIDSCNAGCDANAVVASGWCGRVFKRADCLTACLAAVYAIQKGCYWCCSDGNFYEKCIAPFANITDYMKIPCDPYWD